MFELWARKRAVNEVGSPYTKIFSFDNEDYKYTAVDTLDRSIYQECMVTEGERCILYTKLNKPMIKKLGTKRK